MSKAVELTVLGQRCRVVTTASEQELRVLTKMVEDKLAPVLNGRPMSTQAVLLAAIALANDVIEQQRRADALADKACGALEGLLKRVDSALASADSSAADKIPSAKLPARLPPADDDAKPAQLRPSAQPTPQRPRPTPLYAPARAAQPTHGDRVVQPAASTKPHAARPTPLERRWGSDEDDT